MRRKEKIDSLVRVCVWIVKDNWNERNPDIYTERERRRESERYNRCEIN